jgi:excisionase family DNA binding protein
MTPPTTPSAEQGDETGDDWLGTKEAARHLGITARTLYRFIDEGQLSAYRFGRVIRVRRSDLDIYIDTCRIQPGSLEHLYPEVQGNDA